MLGTKALQIFDETTCVVRAVLRWTEFYAHESCGKCTPCREGTFWLVQILRRLENGDGRRRGPREAARHLATTSSAGRSARSVTARPARSPRRMQYFRDEYLAHFEQRRLPVRPGRLDAVRRRPRWTVRRQGEGPDDGHHRDPAPRSQKRDDLVSVTIDGFELQVPKGTLVIRAAELIGIQVPRFCDHPLLDPVGACRQCLVEVEGQPKPLASCTTTVSDGMVVKTQLTSPVADKAQQGVMELLLINHPLDCPVCDKGGECPLQNQAMSNGRGRVALRGRQAHLSQADQHLLPGAARPRALRALRPLHPLLARRWPATRSSRCSSAGRCSRSASTRPSRSSPTSPATPCRSARSARSPVRPTGSGRGRSTWCPPRASASTARPAARSAPTTGAARSCAGWPATTPQVNEEWNCDKGRWAFQYATAQDRLTTPLVRDDDGTLVPTSWAEALRHRRPGAGRGHAAPPASWSADVPRSRTPTPTRSSPASRSAPTTSTSGPGRTPPRRRRSSPPTSPATASASPTTTSSRPRPCCSSGSSPRRSRRSCSCACARRARKGLAGARGRPVREPGAREAVGDAAQRGARRRGRGARRARGAATTRSADAAAALSADGAVILVGERLAAVPGALSTVARTGRGHRRAASPGCRVAPVSAGRSRPVRCPNLLPGGRPVDRPRSPRRRRDGLGRRPPAAPATAATRRRSSPRVHTGERPGAARRRRRPARPARPDRGARRDRRRAVRRQPRAARVGGDRARRRGAAGRGRRREGRDVRRLGGPLPALRRGAARHQRHARRPCPARARRRDGCRPRPARRRQRPAGEIDEVGLWDGDRAAFASVVAGHAAAGWPPARPCSRPGRSCSTPAGCRTASRTSPARRATPWRGSRRRPPPALGVADGDRVTVATDAGEVTAPVVVTEMPDGVVWLPTNATGAPVRSALRAGHGAVVRLRQVRRVRRAGRCLVMSADLLASPEVQGFGTDPWWLVARQGAGRLRVPRRDDAVHDLVRSAGSSARMQQRIGPNRVGPFGPAAEPRRRHQAGAEGGHHPEGRRQGGLRPRADHLRDAGVPRLRGHPVRPRGLDLRAPDARCS